jgi:hypothetical protein
MVEDRERGVRWALVLLPCVALGCPGVEPGEDGIFDGDVTGPPGGSGTRGSDGSDGATGQPPGTGSGQDGTTSGFIFDVGGATDGETEGPKGGQGGCRASEAYGAAGGFPAYADPGYASFDSTVLIMTSASYTPTDYVLRVIDISGAPPPPNMNYPAPIYTNPAWTSTSFGGQIFGLTLDSEGNVYTAPSRVFFSESTTPGTIYKVDSVTAQVSVFAEVPNAGPAFGNINYDCTSETIRVANHEDGRIWQIEMNGTVRSTYRHGTGDVTMGPANDPGEPDGQFTMLGDRVWAVQSHAGRLYYSVWNEDSGRQSMAVQNEIWSVAYADQQGIPDPTTARLEGTVPGLNGATYSNPVSDIGFAATGWMLASERTMYGDTQTSAHQSTTYEYQQQGDGTWQVVGTTYVVGELPNSAAGGVDHDFEEGGYVWMTGDALDFNTPNVVYGVQGTPYGGGDITNSTLIDHDGEITGQDKGAQGDCEIPIPGDAMPPPPPPVG